MSLVPTPQPQMQAPGNYPGTAQAHLINANHQYYLWYQQPRLAQGTASVAVQFERQKSAFYPYGAAFQVQASADPGVFEMQIQVAEDDVDAMYVSIGTITTLNSGLVGRYDMVSKYAKFGRLYLASVTNLVDWTGIVTR